MSVTELPGRRALFQRLWISAARNCGASDEAIWVCELRHAQARHGTPNRQLLTADDYRELWNRSVGQRLSDWIFGALAS